VIPAVLVAILIIAVAVRMVSRRAVERAVARRLVVGDDGLIAGAEPIVLADPPSRNAVLLLHGFGDTPQTLRHLARELAARGSSVYVPLLPGHGRTLGAFRASSRAQWEAQVRWAYDEIAHAHEKTAVVGLSMGGALAVLLADAHPEIASLALIAPYFEPRASVRWVARLATPLGAVLPLLYGRSPRSIHDPVERERSLAYGAVPPRLIAELVTLADDARATLPRIRVPTLYVQSRDDNRVSGASAERAFEALAAPEKRLEWVTGSGHVLTVDFGWQRVVEMTAEWVQRHFRHAGTVTSPAAEHRAAERAR